MSIEKTSLFNPKRPALTARLLLCLLDEQPTCLGDIWSFVADSLEPPQAINSFISYRLSKKSTKEERKAATEQRQKIVQQDYQAAINEGRRLCLQNSLRHLQSKNLIQILHRERGEPEGKNTLGSYDHRRTIVQLTPQGMEYAMSRANGSFTKITKELWLGLRRKALRIWIEAIPPEERGL